MAVRGAPRCLGQRALGGQSRSGGQAAAVQAVVESLFAWGLGQLDHAGIGAVHGSCVSALFIHLGGLTEMSLDESTGIASVSPAVHRGETLNTYLARFGRFFLAVAVPPWVWAASCCGGFRGWGWAVEQVANDRVPVTAVVGPAIRRAERPRTRVLRRAHARGSGLGPQAGTDSPMTKPPCRLVPDQGTVGEVRCS